MGVTEPGDAAIQNARTRQWVPAIRCIENLDEAPP
jgi:hypothetical protein